MEIRKTAVVVKDHVKVDAAKKDHRNKRAENVAVLENVEIQKTAVAAKEHVKVDVAKKDHKSKKALVEVVANVKP